MATKKRSAKMKKSNRSILTYRASVKAIFSSEVNNMMRCYKVIARSLKNDQIGPKFEIKMNRFELKETL
ncbi:MAG: hypothetical protein BroJett040_03390 [Oligoflexia bacterium]|nr:MAG: hypothetical protein BroJett040_03390 [Oligoflexia bacterium]